MWPILPRKRASADAKNDVQPTKKSEESWQEKVTHSVEKMWHILLRKGLAAHQKKRYPSSKKSCWANQEKH